MVLIDTLHPVHEGRAFQWFRDEPERDAIVEYGRTDQGEAAESWQRSPFFHLLQVGRDSLRFDLTTSQDFDIPVLNEMRAQGQTEFLVMIHRFGDGSIIGEMDCVYSLWSTDSPDGLAQERTAFLQDLFPTLALALKSASLRRIAGTLVETYLGRDAGQRVLNGRIIRGVADEIDAVIWYSDLIGFTRISETAPRQIIPFLNAYMDAVVSSVHDCGGDVLKLIGDGTLAIFSHSDAADACHCALEAEAILRARIERLNRERAEMNLPTTDVYLGLHVGQVFYGNVGSQDRLDFTVVGPSVNEVSRIATLSRSLEQTTLISSAFAGSLRALDRSRLVSVGRYALRGVRRPQELFTIDHGERDGS
jgi:adenylate cyclase